MKEIELIEKFDQTKICEIYNSWPEIAENTFESNLKPIEIGEIDHIVFSGMGGSGALGDIFSAILSRTSIHVTVVKGYLLPKTVDKKTLVVITSVSGNTQETFSVLKEAKKMNANIIAFSSGGLIKKFCIENKIQYREIKEYHSPRASFPSFLYGMLKILGPILPITNNEIYESINELKKISINISSNNLNENNSSLKLAKWISNIPMIYYPSGFQAAAIRFKNSMQENAKIHAMAEDIIETCHNGIVAWEKLSKVKPILIEGFDDHEKTKQRWKILREFLKKENIEFKEINSIQGNILSKIINLIYQLDYVSIYTAILNKIDPSPVKSIDFIKSKLDN